MFVTIGGRRIVMDHFRMIEDNGRLMRVPSSDPRNGRPGDSKRDLLKLKDSDGIVVEKVQAA